MAAKDDCVALFMDRYKNDKLTPDKQPNCGNNLSPEYVREQINEYREVLASDEFFKSIVSK